VVAGIMAIIECWLAQKMVDEMARAASASVTGPAEVADKDDGDRARASEWACMACCYCRADALGGGRGQEE
jgi:hypothetical protein